MGVNRSTLGRLGGWATHLPASTHPPRPACSVCALELRIHLPNRAGRSTADAACLLTRRKGKGRIRCNNFASGGTQAEPPDCGQHTYIRCALLSSSRLGMPTLAARASCVRQMATATV
mmetsp:Transcript_4727/g.11764  ORF Transcript_4727/g.11764 Transcript_4727/m.11764 type:complete len:118 (-) Transcript_4727:81-434(-)